MSRKIKLSDGKFVTLSFDENDKLHGDILIEEKNGSKHAFTYKNGVIDGVYTNYDKKNKVISRVIFENGIEKLD